MAFDALARWAAVLLVCSVAAGCGGGGTSEGTAMPLSSLPGGLVGNASDQACEAIAANGGATRPDGIRAACMPPGTPVWADRVAVGFKSATVIWNAVEGAERYEVVQDDDGAGPAPEQAAAQTTGTEYTVALTRLVYEYANTLVRVRACNAAGCSAFSEARGLPIWVDVVGAQDWDIQGFGRTVTLSADGKTMAVASRQGGSGIVQLFTRASGWWWQQQATLRPLQRSEDFGAALALSADGSTLVVGSPSDDWTGTDVGGAEVYVRNGETWTHQGALRSNSMAAQGRFGASVAIAADGNTLAVGAPGHDFPAPGVGAAFVYTRAGGTWSLDARVMPLGPLDTGDAFGSAVALSADGRTLAVGAPGDDCSVAGINRGGYDEGAPDSGAAYVFTRGATSWVEQAYVKPSNPLVSGAFGAALALAEDGGMLAVGAPQERSAATGVNGDQADTSAPGAGAVYLFARSGITWTQAAYVKAGNTGAGDQFGTSVALGAGGQRLAVGAVGEDGGGTFIGGLDGVQYGTDGNLRLDSGAVYTFDRELTGGWRARAYLKPYVPYPGTLPPLLFGRSISFSGDGNMLSVGEEGYNSSEAVSGMVLTY